MLIPMSMKSRMEHTDALTSTIEQAALRQTNNNRPMAGALVLLIHTLVVTIILWLVLWSKTRVQVYVGLALWLIIMFQHWYFGGCWGVRSERRIWKTTEWYGPWTSLFTVLHDGLGIPNSRVVHEAIFIVFGVSVLGVATQRLMTMS